MRRAPPDFFGFTEANRTQESGTAPWQYVTAQGLRSGGDVMYAWDGPELQLDLSALDQASMPDDMAFAFGVSDANRCVAVSVARPIAGITGTDLAEVFPDLSGGGEETTTTSGGSTSTTPETDETAGGTAVTGGAAAARGDDGGGGGGSGLVVLLVLLALAAIAALLVVLFMRRRGADGGDVRSAAAAPACVKQHEAWQAELRRLRASEQRVRELERLIEREARDPAASETQRADWAGNLERANETLERDRRKAAEAEAAYQRCIGAASRPAPTGTPSPTGTQPDTASAGTSAVVGGSAATATLAAVPDPPLAARPTAASVPPTAGSGDGPPCAPGTIRNVTAALRTFHDVLADDRPVRVTIHAIDRARAAEPVHYSVAEFHAYHHDPNTGLGAGDTRFTFVVEVRIADRTVRCERDEECVDGMWVPVRTQRQVADANERWEVVFRGADPIDVGRGEVGRTIRRLYEDAKPTLWPYEQRTFEAASLCPDE